LPWEALSVKRASSVPLAAPVKVAITA
jgi:hypothetical protein